MRWIKGLSIKQKKSSKKLREYMHNQRIKISLVKSGKLEAIKGVLTDDLKI